jgi:hypothetical protein
MYIVPTSDTILTSLDMKKPSTTVYRGIRVKPDERTVSPTLVYVDEKPLSAEPSLKIVRHSPDGFNWGYGGSGPAQLALAILLDYYGKDAPELRHYQSFKFDAIAVIPQEEDWTMTGAEIELAMKGIMAEKS